MTDWLRSKIGVVFAAVFAIAVFAPAVVAADLKVVTTVGDLGAMAEEIVGEDGEVESLVRPGEDPHFVDPRPSYARSLNEADMVVYVGLELEVGWLPTLIQQARNPAIQSGRPGHFDASNYVQTQGVPAGEIDRSMGDVHPGGNPHYNLDPRQMARAAMAFGDALGEIEPAMAEEFEHRSREFAREAIRFAQKWENKFDELSDRARQLIGYHDAWIYVGEWLGIDIPIELEPKPGVPPNPSHVADVIEVVDNRGVGVIIQLEYYSTETAEQIDAQTDRDVHVLSVPAQAREGQQYLEHLEGIVEPLYEAIKQVDEAGGDQ